jgi:hypothetical protein
MVVQLPPTQSPATETDTEAGVIEDARRRQRRHRWTGASAVVAAIVALGVIFGLSGGGGGTGRSRGGRNHASNSGAVARTSSRVGAAVAAAPPTIGESGLLRPGVGWAANGFGFYMTWDGGRLWSKITVPGLGGDVLGNMTAATSPNPHTLILAFSEGGSLYGTCADPGPVGSVGRPAGDVAVSFNSGRAWRTFAVHRCRVITELSAVNTRTEFAMSAAAKPHGPELLFRTGNGARSWQFVGHVPAQGPIDFTSLRNGWLLGSDRLYRTTDGGRSWIEASACRSDVRQDKYCGLPHFFGSDGVLQAVARSAKSAGNALIYTTRNAGLTWSRHRVVLHTPDYNDDHLPTAFSAPNARTLYVYILQGILAKSNDGGDTWNDLPAPRFNGGTTLDFANADYGWLQDGGHIFSTTNGGRSWTRIRQRK